MTAIDEAGNIGQAVSKEPVKVDLKVPRIKKQIQVNPSEGERQSHGLPPVPAPSSPQPMPDSRAQADWYAKH